EYRCSSAIAFFQLCNFKGSEKSNAHHILSKCLKHLSSCSDTELQEKAKKITKSLKTEEKMNNLNERQYIANKKIKAYDAQQRKN
ncbi:1069_t:CDS:2, partial [Dentiscutata erythropus]